MELASVLVSVMALLSAIVWVTPFIRSHLGVPLGLIGAVLFSLSACSDSEVADQPEADRGSETSNKPSHEMAPITDSRGSDESRIAALPRLPAYDLVDDFDFEAALEKLQSLENELHIAASHTPSALSDTNPLPERGQGT